VVVNNQLLVFGGADRTSRTYEDLWALSLGGYGQLPNLTPITVFRAKELTTYEDSSPQPHLFLQTRMAATTGPASAPSCPPSELPRLDVSHSRQPAMMA
jgi:hypothetical protein